jgi:hypothetical protein
MIEKFLVDLLLWLGANYSYYFTMNVTLTLVALAFFFALQLIYNQITVSNLATIYLIYIFTLAILYSYNANEFIIV